MEPYTKVFAENLSEYDANKIEKIIRDSLVYLNIEIPKNKKILIKPNVLGAYTPDKNVTTNPTIVEAITRILLENNNSIIIGDSSGNRLKFGTNEALKISGIQALERENVKIVSFDRERIDMYENEKNLVLKKVPLTGLIKDVDYIINLPKLKSHQFTAYTGAVKNFFGCVPGGTKQQLHATAPNPVKFSDLLVDIYEFIKPKVLFNIMDGIIGMEGKGPGPSGDLIKSNLLAISRNAIALDFYCCDYIGIKPESISTNKAAINRNLFNGKFIANKELKKISFKLPKSIKLPDLIYGFFAQFSHPKPDVIKEKCKKCAICFKACPTNAISMKPYPEFDRKKCIYCFCCHENCPEKSIELKDNIILKFAKKFYT